MGYIPEPGTTNTNAYRDWNNDGVRDQSGNVYNNPNYDPNYPNNVVAGRAWRYADIVRALE